MGLIIPGSPAFTWCVDTNTGTPSATLPGVNFTYGASNADGTTVQLLSSTARDACYLVVGICGAATSGENNSALADILWDPAGGTAWTNFIDNLVSGFSAAVTATIGFAHWYHFPIWVPAGTSLAIRARKAGATAATAGRAMMFLYGEPRRPDMWWCGQKVESLGINEASSAGTTITAGNTGAWGAWTTIGTSTRRYGAIQFGDNGSDSNALSAGYFWQLGLGSQQMPGTPTWYATTTNGESGSRSGNGIIWCDVASGSTLQMRGTCSTTAENHNVAVYGVY